MTDVGALTDLGAPDGPRTTGPRLVEPDGGDAPAWSRRRVPGQLPQEGRPGPGGPQTPYAELHCHSAFSFLDGASQPEDLVEEAVRLGLSALALTDHDGLYGVVRFAEAARVVGLPTVFGAEISLGASTGRAGETDPSGDHLLVLARDPEGYRRLSRLLSDAHLAGGEKGRLVAHPEQCAQAAGGHWQVLTGCRKGTVARALARGGPAAAGAALTELVALFGRGSVAVEITDHGHPDETDRNDVLAALAQAAGLPLVATGNVHYAVPGAARLAATMAAVRARRSLDEMDGWLPVTGSAHLRSGAEMTTRFARYPGAVEQAARLGAECAFDLHLVAPKLPDFPVPPGHTEASWLRLLTMQGAARRYGPPGWERVAGAYDQLAHELTLIEQLGFPGYFLIVHDIVEFCRRHRILCQGRGSAANSAVCYALGITGVDAVSFGLLFERFLAPERDGPPDIDLDIESGRREEVIQYVYRRYGRSRAAQVANVITYRPRSAVRDVARALGFSPGQQDAWSRQLDRWSLPIQPVQPSGPVQSTRPVAGSEHDIPSAVIRLSEQLLGFPRHLGIHSGGMVICDRPVGEVVPVEWARMPGRTVIQWDKDDCAAAGLVKFDLLGLGMLGMLHRAFDLIRDHHGRDLDLSSIPPEDPAVYDMLCAADSIGVFQVESRAQMATLPRLRPRRFYDLVIEVALIRPGPIQGRSVHPYLRRRSGAEAVTYPHPLLRRSLAKTLGVPLFQEQLMQMAIDIAGFSAAEADELRRAMSAKRSAARIERLRGRLYDGMAASGITGELADDLYAKLSAFASFGFPESHSVSFALLVYASSWIKLYYPAVFCAALLNAQPMGFYSPQSLVADARRHGVEVLRPDLNASAAQASLVGAPPRVRLGLTGVRRVGGELARRIVERRMADGPYADMADLVRRVGVSVDQLEALATAGAFGCFGLARREALWAAGAVAQARPDRLAGMVFGADVRTVAPYLPGMSEAEESLADLWATGITPAGYPTRFLRERLAAQGVTTAAGLQAVTAGRRVLVAGIVTHRQRPATAAGTTFVNLEDETGLVNVICSPGLWTRHRTVARTATALVVRGRVERAEDVVNVIAERMWPLSVSVPRQSRDFR
ncbi:error-prone DNA polymerase [Frankia sp. R82]|uniref:error-prone DNA polymerase n=1 Tax=Frankia sp. R82 TaxID=2950553 RepID=UPI0020431689|nr:error-prone DNA polymerase [Frankia sp. R82]MCM3886432.1 error-prone DNA polymerase [Frankia sp. R82]